MNFEYSIPVSELDAIIEKMNMGIEPFISDIIRKEVEIRKKELMAEALDEDIDEVDMEEYNRHRAEIKAHQEAQKRKATREERGAFITLTRDKYSQLLDEMSTSYVEYNPDCPYHLSDEDLNADAEYLVLKQKMSKLKNCYYNAQDWINAVGIIMQMAKYECTHDYMWLGYSGTKGVEAFNDGKIKINPGVIPKLFIDFTKELKDPKVLADIIRGDTTVVTHDIDNNKSKNKVKPNPISYPYEVITSFEYELHNDMKNRGIDTPLNSVINYSTGLFNRSNIIPTSPIFSLFNTKTKRNDEIQLGNFLSDNGGHDKYNTDNDIKINAVDVIKEFNKDNNNKLNRSAVDGVNEFVTSLANSTVVKPNARSVESIVDDQNEDVLRVEQSILDAIRNTNPDL